MKFLLYTIIINNFARVILPLHVEMTRVDYGSLRVTFFRERSRKKLR